MLFLNVSWLVIEVSVLDIGVFCVSRLSFGKDEPVAVGFPCVHGKPGGDPFQVRCCLGAEGRGKAARLRQVALVFGRQLFRGKVSGV